MSVDLDSLLQKLDGARSRRTYQDPDDDYDPFAPLPPPSNIVPPHFPNNNNSSPLATNNGGPPASGFGDQPWPGSSTGWGVPPAGEPTMWPQSNLPSAYHPSIGPGHLLPGTHMGFHSQLRAIPEVPSGFPSPDSARTRGPGGLPSAQHTQIGGALQLSGVHPQQQYPSPQETISPLGPARTDNAVPYAHSSPMQNGAPPTVLINGHKSKSISGEKGGAAEEDFGDDDGWIDSAIAEMNDLEGEFTIVVVADLLQRLGSLSLLSVAPHRTSITILLLLLRNLNMIRSPSLRRAVHQQRRCASPNSVPRRRLSPDRRRPSVPTCPLPWRRPIRLHLADSSKRGRFRGSPFMRSVGAH